MKQTNKQIFREYLSERYLLNHLTLFFTKPDMAVHHRDPECHAKRLGPCLQGQGYSAVSNPRKITTSATSPERPSSRYASVPPKSGPSESANSREILLFKTFRQTRVFHGFTWSKENVCVSHIGRRAGNWTCHYTGEASQPQCFTPTSVNKKESYAKRGEMKRKKGQEQRDGNDCFQLKCFISMHDM